MSGDDKAELLYLSLLGLFLVLGLFSTFRTRFVASLQQAAIWGLIFCGIIIVYSFRDVIEAELYPGNAVVVNGDAIELRRARDGHFYATLEINGKDVDFIVDTGASNVVLTREDARLLGFDPENLNYLGRANTANGQVRTATVRLDRVDFGGVVVQDLRAAVNDGPMFSSLLGMSYLSRFSRIEIEGEKLRLVW